jgi:hypothetical protein
MAILQGPCDSFRFELLTGVHDFLTDAFKLALYTPSAELSALTTAYSATNEVSGAGYTAGGIALTASVASSGGTAYVDFADVVFAGATLTARGALIYNSSKADRAVYVLDFGLDRAATAQDFTITFPAATSATALIRLG